MRDSDSFVVANVKTLFVILGVWWVLQIKQYLYGKLICVCSQESRAMVRSMVLHAEAARLAGFEVQLQIFLAL